MMRHVRFIGLLIALRLSHLMVFRLSFFGAFFADGALFAVQLLAFRAVFSQVDSIGTWGYGQMTVFIGTFSLINSLNLLVCTFGVMQIPEKVRDGTLDHYLTKPVNALLRLSLERFDPAGIPLIALSVIIITYGASTAGVAVTVPVALLYIALVLVMSLLWYDMSVILRTLSFFFHVAGDIDPIERMEAHLLDLNFKIPGIIYDGLFKALFYFVLPYGIMATVPAQALTGTLTGRGLLHALGVAAVFTVISLKFWRFGLKRYKSTGG
jgi:ABC-2 type transport system permease protein